MIPPPQSPPVQISFQLTQEDFSAMQELHQWRRRGMWGPIVYWGCIVFFAAMGCWLLWESHIRGEPDYGIFFLYMAFALLMPALKYIYVPAMRRRRFQASKLGRQPIRLTADRDCLAIEFGDSSSRTAWTDMERCDRTQDHFFFWLDRHQAVIVPLSAFRDDDMRERLWTFAIKGSKPAHA